jgi:protein subunit release factor A
MALITLLERVRMMQEHDADMGMPVDHSQVIKKKRRVPKGTSSYQAAWIIDDINEEEEQESDMSDNEDMLPHEDSEEEEQEEYEDLQDDQEHADEDASDFEGALSPEDEQEQYVLPDCYTEHSQNI